MAREEFERFKQEIRWWLDSHPDEYDAFVEEMNDKSFTGIQRCYKFLLDTDARTGKLPKEAGIVRSHATSSPSFCMK